ncbi:MAG TPA: hypothetical protein V6D11_22570 [Waterburya sp.]|jgi:hypothetical protein
MLHWVKVALVLQMNAQDEPKFWHQQQVDIDSQLATLGKILLEHNKI